MRVDLLVLAVSLFNSGSLINMDLLELNFIAEILFKVPPLILILNGNADALLFLHNFLHVVGEESVE